MKLNLKNKLNFVTNNINLLFIFAGIIYSIYLYRFIYDGHHHGLIYSYSQDLLKGYMPYKEIWLQYGIIHVLINTIFIFFFKNIFVINLITITLYYLSLFLIYKIILNKCNLLLALTSLLILIFNHPIPQNPWPNYYSFFFLVLSFYFFEKKNKYLILISGLLFGSLALIRTEFIFPILIYTLTQLFLIFFFKQKYFFTFNNKFYFLGIIIPILFFITFLYYNNIFSYWLKYFNIYKLYLNDYETNIFNLVFNFIKFYLFSSFLNIINEPQYILISVILISNFFLLFLFFLSKNYFFFNFSFITLLLCALCIQSRDLMNPYTSLTFGIIPLFFFINKFFNRENKILIIFILFLISFYSIVFYPLGNLPNLKSYFRNNKVFYRTNVNLFSFQKWPDNFNTLIFDVNSLKNKIISNCKIKYFDNLISDVYFYNIFNLYRKRTVPFLNYNKLGTLVDKNFNYNYEIDLNAEIDKENIILLFDENFVNNEINLNNKFYTIVRFNINPLNIKPFYYKVYFPKKCLL